MRHVLDEGPDFIFNDIVPIELTTRGFARMLAAHVRGDEVAIEIDGREIVVLRASDAASVSAELTARMKEIAKTIGNVD